MTLTTYVLLSGFIPPQGLIRKTLPTPPAIIQREVHINHIFSAGACGQKYFAASGHEAVVAAAAHPSPSATIVQERRSNL